MPQRDKGKTQSTRKENKMNSLIGTADCPKEYYPPPLSKRLSQRKQELESQLEKINKALDLLEKTPQIAILMDTISQLNV